MLSVALEYNKTLTKLDIAQTNIEPEGVKYLEHAIISNKTLKELKVNNNNLGSDDGSKVIAEILIKQQSLEKLDISNNNIKDKGIKNHIAKALGLTKIKEVIMKINGITDDGAEYIVDSVYKKITLDIRGNDIISEELINQIQELGNLPYHQDFE